MNDNLSVDEIIDSIKEEDNENKKKKRGRPPKNKVVEKVKEKNSIENEEIILHLKISKKEIDEQKKKGVSLIDIDNNLNSITDEQTDKMKDTTKISNLKHIIKILSDENKNLKEYIDKLSPVFNTEIKYYPENVNLVDTNNILIEPKITDICCYNCCHEFDTYPIYDIIGYKNNTFIVSKEGKTKIFCSFNCYLTNILTDVDYIKKDCLLKKLYYEIFKNKIQNIDSIFIKPADDKSVLKKFGGPFTIKEYRMNFKLIIKETRIMEIPFVATPFVLEETTKQNNKIDYLLNNNPNLTIKK